jgi:hypothetical protein
MDILNAISLLRLQGLQVDSVTAKLSAELYSQCKLADPNDIRLLRLLPAISTVEAFKVKQPLVAQMFSGSLYELKGRYKSLSYVWDPRRSPNLLLFYSLNPEIRLSCSRTA